jgi:hypothetical protein
LFDCLKIDHNVTPFKKPRKGSESPRHAEPRSQLGAAERARVPRDVNINISADRLHVWAVVEVHAASPGDSTLPASSSANIGRTR